VMYNRAGWYKISQGNRIPINVSALVPRAKYSALIHVQNWRMATRLKIQCILQVSIIRIKLLIVCKEYKISPGLIVHSHSSEAESQLMKKLLDLYRPRKFITLFVKTVIGPHHNKDDSSPLLNPILKFILILLSHQITVLQNHTDIVKSK
jgi:hypothetical protein